MYTCFLWLQKFLSNKRLNELKASAKEFGNQNTESVVSNCNDRYMDALLFTNLFRFIGASNHDNNEIRHPSFIYQLLQILLSLSGSLLTLSMFEILITKHFQAVPPCKVTASFTMTCCVQKPDLAEGIDSDGQVGNVVHIA